MIRSKIISLSNRYHLYAFLILFIILTLFNFLYFIVLLIYIVFLYKRKLLNKKVIILIILFIAYFIFVQTKDSIFIGKEEIKGIVYEADKYQTYTLVKVKTLFEKVSIYYYGDKNIELGDIVTFSNLDTNSLGKDYSNYLKSQGIFQTYRSYDVTIEGQGFSLSLLNGKILKFYEKRLTKVSYNYISSLVFSKSEFDNNFKDSINNIGISYLFCISGYHIQLIANLLEKVLNKYIKIKYKTDTIVSVFLVIYTIVCMAPFGIFRATIMFILSKINFHKQYNLTKLDILSISFIINIIMNPMCVHSMSFKLSYLITLFIIIGSELIKSDSKLISYYKVSILSFFTGLPLIISINYKINLLTIVISPIFLLIFTYLIMPMTYLLVLFPFLSTIFDIFYIFFQDIVSNIDNIKIFIINLRSFKAFGYIIYYYSLYKLLVSYESGNIKYINLVYIAILIAFIRTSNLLDPYDKIIMLDVSQGDSILIKKAHNKGNILIDSYGNNIDKLKDYGIREIDTLIITHSDYDHIGSAKDLVLEFKTKTLVSSYYDDSIEITELRNLVITNYIFKSDDKICINDIDFFFYGPVKDSSNINDISLVFEIKLDHFEMLFTGDMEENLENDIIDIYSSIETDVLKVPHHGSNTSLSKYFLDNVKFEEALISVGIKNRYGHPHIETLNKLKNHNIYRTDKDGDIIITILPNSYKIQRKERFNLFYN